MIRHETKRVLKVYSQTLDFLFMLHFALLRIIDVNFAFLCKSVPLPQHTIVKCICVGKLIKNIKWNIQKETNMILY